MTVFSSFTPTLSASQEHAGTHPSQQGVCVATWEIKGWGMSLITVGLPASVCLRGPGVGQDNWGRFSAGTWPRIEGLQVYTQGRSGRSA